MTKAVRHSYPCALKYSILFLVLFFANLFLSFSAAYGHAVSVEAGEDGNKFFSIKDPHSGLKQYQLPQQGAGSISGLNSTTLFVTRNGSVLSKSDSKQGLMIQTASMDGANGRNALSQASRSKSSVLNQNVASSGSESSDSSSVNEISGLPGMQVEPGGSSNSNQNASGNNSNEGSGNRAPRNHSDDLPPGPVQNGGSNSAAGQQESNSSNGGTALRINFSQAQFVGEVNTPIVLNATVSGGDTNFPIVASWSFVSGPQEPEFQDSSALNLVATFLVEGDYLLLLRVTRGNQSASATAMVSVLPPNGNRPGNQLILYVNASSNVPDPDGSIDAPFTTLQAAVDAAQNGYQIQVSQGTYTNPAGFILDFQDKGDIQILGGFAAPGSEVRDPVAYPSVIDGEAVPNRSTVLVRFKNSYNVLFSGFTISNATGGALRIAYSIDVAVEHCKFLSNQNTRVEPNTGAAINVSHSNAVLAYNQFRDNSSSFNGGAVRSDYSTVLIHNSYFFNNHSEIYGGALYSMSSDLTVDHVTFAKNSVTNPVGGKTIFNDLESHLNVSNSIFWNGAEATIQPHIMGSSVFAPVVNYSIVQYGFPGEGNLTVRPYFVNLGGGILHLQSMSPAINSGDPNFISDIAPMDFDGDLRVLGGQTDMGYDEFTIRGDMNGDGTIDNFDLDLFVEALAHPYEYRINHPELNFLTGDMNYDERVDFDDIDLFVCKLNGTC